MQIVDNQDMTIGIWVFPETDISSVSLELIAAIKQGYLTVKAAGVWGGSIQIPAVETPSEGNRFFGFDMDNEYITGFDTAHGDFTVMAKNDFKPFATGASANVITQADYEALTALLTGFQAGKASSAQINKAIRQATFRGGAGAIHHQ
jgi:hypothetical protein